jgi:hypothetical protein
MSDEKNKTTISTAITAMISGGSGSNRGSGGRNLTAECS